MEKLAHFDPEVIPERRMLAKGWGAYGTFTVTHDQDCPSAIGVVAPDAIAEIWLHQIPKTRVALETLSTKT